MSLEKSLKCVIFFLPKEWEPCYSLCYVFIALVFIPGECLAVFTPDQEFSCCELSLDGKAVILGLKGSNTITTLLLCRESTVEEEMPKITCYGDPQLKGNTFDMSHDGQ